MKTVEEVVDNLPKSPASVKTGEFAGGKFAEEKFKGAQTEAREKRIIDYRDKKGEINVGRLESALGLIFNNVKTGDTKNAERQVLAAQQGAPKGTEFRVFKFGGDSEVNKNALQVLANKLSDKSGVTVNPNDLLQMNEEELSKTTGIPKEQLKEGVIISGYGSGTGAGFQAFPMNQQGYAGIVQEMGKGLDPKDMKKLLDKNVDFILSKVPPVKQPKAVKPSASNPLGLNL